MKKRRPIFERLRAGLQEAIAHEKGELSLRTIELPDDPPEIDGTTLAALRTRASMSQAVFAKVLNVSTKTLQSWEQGARKPSQATRRLIHIFSVQPADFCRIVGLPEVHLDGVHIERGRGGKRRIVVA